MINSFFVGLLQFISFYILFCSILFDFFLYSSPLLPLFAMSSFMLSNSKFLILRFFCQFFLYVPYRLLPHIALTVNVCRNYRMKIAATRDRAEVLLRNQEKIASLSSLSTGMISGN